MSEKQSPTILIVDDEADLREAIAFDFRRNNFSVLTAACGDEAFQIIEKTPVDIVLSDVCMPNGDGVELLEKIKARDANNPIVMFISGFSEIRLEDAYQKGIEAFFGKPFDRQALMAAVNHSINVSRRWRSRKTSRVELTLKIDVNFLSSNFSVREAITGIGPRGTFIPCNSLFPVVGEELEFSITSLFERNFNVRGSAVVRWIRNLPEGALAAGCGIEFVQIPADGMSKLVELINFTKTKSFLPYG
jgi:CheY-like chemotaxis protein